MSMEWIKVDINKVNENPKSQNFGDVEVRVYFSPYDVPDWIGVGDDEADGNLLLEFKYIQDEECNPPKQIKDGVFLTVGRKSGRIHSIAFTPAAVETAANGGPLKLIRKTIKELKTAPEANRESAMRAIAVSRERFQKALN